MIAVCCLVGNSSGIPINVATRGPKVKCVSRYGDLTHRNSDGLGEGGKQMFQQDLLSARGVGQRAKKGHSRRSATELQTTMGDWSGRNAEGGKYLFC